MTSDEAYYEQSFLDTHPTLLRAQFMPSLKLQAKISSAQLGATASLSGLKNASDDDVTLTAEILSVLSRDDIVVCRVLGEVEADLLNWEAEASPS